jgi:hypothetical protein
MTREGSLRAERSTKKTPSETTTALCSEGGREAGLARAPGTGEGDHGGLRGAEQLCEGGEVLFSAD